MHLGYCYINTTNINIANILTLCWNESFKQTHLSCIPKNTMNTIICDAFEVKLYRR